MDDHAYYVPVGNSTETGLIKFLQDAQIPVHEVIKEKLGRIETQIPFSTSEKKMITAVRFPQNEDIVRVYVKGAPEYIVNKCVRTYNEEGKQILMSND